MLIKINGAESEISDNASVRDLLSARKLPVEVIIIELNGAVVGRDLWENTRLNPRDNLEIIRILGGG